MPKQRISALDVRALVADLQSKIVGLRLQNVYDINSKTYLFKFAKTDHKVLFLVESGIRMHTTQFTREKSVQPSSFSMKLRKHLRSKRLVSVKQLGFDRALDMQFGEGEHAYHVIIEFYASGNIILTDHRYQILNVLRVVTLEVPAEGEEADRMKIAVGQTYDSSYAREFQPMTMERLQSLFQQDKGQKKDPNLRKFLRDALSGDYGPTLVDDILVKSGLPQDVKVSAFDKSQLVTLFSAFQQADEFVKSCATTSQPGYIVLMDKPSPEGEDLYDEFHPNLFGQFSKRQFKQFPDFDGAVDDYFSNIEAQKGTMKAQLAEQNALKKLDAARKEHETRVKGLEHAQEKNMVLGRAIERHLETVERVMGIIRSYIAAGFDWKDIDKIVKEEQRKGNPDALIIDQLKLEKGLISMKLPDPDVEEADSDEEMADETDSDEEDVKPVPIHVVDIDIYSTCHANARRYYEARKIAAVKHEKTLQATKKALKQVEKRVHQELKQVKVQQKTTGTVVGKVRKPLWFEKFHWFISSENYLVVGGKDATQNELLVRRYMKRGDVYVHADLHGAASVLIKNPYSFDAEKDKDLPPPPPGVNAENPIPPATLLEAGTMSVCTSKAWEAKIVTSAWWVFPHQVSKSAPTGEYLTQGSFMIRGKKNWLPPVQLMYGYGLLFRVEEGSLSRHLNERRPWARGMVMETLVEPEMAEDDAASTSSGSDEGGDGEEGGEEDEIGKVVEESREQDGMDDNQETVEPVEEEPTQAEDEQESSDEEMEFPDTQIEDKYKLHEVEQEDVEETQQAEAGQGGRHLSAKQRRDMKKGKQGEPSNPQPTNSKPKQQAPTQVPRGKKGKLKKLKEKYADQSDEERELALALLGSAGKGSKKGNQKDTKPSQPTRSTPNQVATKMEKLKVEEKDIDLDDDEGGPSGLASDIAIIDALTGIPHESDDIMYAIPVCAPWSALQRYKFKVKLLPGSLKKGKAAKSALNTFEHQKDSTPREKECVRVVPEVDAIATMLAKVKIQVPQNAISEKGKKRK